MVINMNMSYELCLLFLIYEKRTKKTTRFWTPLEHKVTGLAKTLQPLNISNSKARSCDERLVISTETGEAKGTWADGEDGTGAFSGKFLWKFVLKT